MEQEIKNPVLRFVVHAHLVLAVGAAAQVWWIGEEWFGEGSSSKAVAAFFATMACYGYHRLMRARDTSLHGVPLFTWYREHHQWIAVLIAVSIVVALTLLLQDLPQLLQRLWPVILPAVLYLTPFRTKAGAVLGLRQVPGLKSLLVAWAWSAGTVLLAADDVRGMAWLLVVPLLSFYWSMAIAFDLRDMNADPRCLRTLPQLIGSRAARALALLMLLPVALVLFISMALRAYPRTEDARPEADWSFALPLLGLAIPVVLILRSSPDRPWLHWFALDACIALIPLLSMFGHLV